MDPQQAASHLEVIRTLMERTCQYQLLTARAAISASVLALAGGAVFLFEDAANPIVFGLTWGVVFAGALLASFVATVCRGRERGERVWSRQTRLVLFALLPSLLAAGVLTVFFFVRAEHLWLPGVWMLCYGQGALATAAYAPPPIRWLGWTYLALGALTLALGPAAAVGMMSLGFGLGHLGLGLVLRAAERREARLRLHQAA